ncbi:hypothetical protein HPB51_016504 [Rhipicephalus microplus]|uniref:Uncharacterized protein n=1 Tax=Rhipicephalus microplus TaxID=6941 RepID=A0A9J6E1G6_RHIMP|nr:hypothetical protein HPB51_016504 [Rhipicephalus microplus]
MERMMWRRVKKQRADALRRVTLDGGENILAETVSAENLVSCSRVKHGVPYFDQQDSTDLMNFKVYELHHGSEDPTVLFEQISKDKGDGYTLPPFVFVETGGKIVFSGKFHGHSLPTNKISVMYGGTEATTVQGPPLDRQAWLVMQFYTTKIAISLADSRSQEPSVISRFRVKDDGTIDPTDKGTVKAITINRNFQVDNVFVVSMYYYNVVNMHETGTHLVPNFKGAHAVALYCRAAAGPGKRVAPSDDWSSTGSSQAKALFQGLQSSRELSFTAASYT